jgi:hypothetical protein
VRPAARTRRRLLTAAALLIVLGGGLAAAASTRHPAPIGAGVRPATRATSVVPDGTSNPDQPLAPQVSLAGLRWNDFHGVALPSSAAAGPHDTNRGIAAGFTHSPLGALLAGVNIGVRANAQWGPRIFTAVIRRQVTGPDTAALLANCQSA